VGRDERTPILYLAPWVDYGGTDKGTIDWFRWLDRDRFAPSLVTTQPSLNRRLAELAPYAEEVWPLSDLVAGPDMPRFIFDFLHTREVEVLHVMNSRLGYELLPDLACLPRPPKVVVQLHVEEADRSGYVRYVTTRYGNLVHAFSVTSEQLADAVHGYGIPRDRIHVIYTGVDAEEEFSPDRVEPAPGLDPERAHVLYPGRLVDQKDPLLMVDVVTALRDRGLRFQVHAVGEGDLEGEVRRRITERGLDEVLIIHPPTPDLARWFAACDALLMTSEYEGVPYVVFEAMAMGLPAVVPALPGNVELLGELSDGLVEPRHDVDGYVTRLAGLIEDGERRRELGRRARERVRERFSLQRMGAEHSELYERLIDAPPEPAEPNGRVAPAPPIRFRRRALYDTPLVSVIVPCFNHGRFLRECIEAVRAQTHPAVEIFVVDDASNDAETIAAIDELDRSDDVTAIRMAENGGPSRARNAALERCTGRYVLPVDADNVLLPDAIERLVEQIRSAGEQVGFIYPNLQYFGNREDYFEAPEWDLYELMQRNVCDVCSLFDRELFDAGERFDERIRLGHEDWEFVLRLAARGVQGEPARGPTVLYRKVGFNRSDSVEYASSAFHEAVRKMVPLYEREIAIKAECEPAVSLIALAPIDGGGEAGRRLAQRLAQQSCADVELVARFDGGWPLPEPVPPVRRIPPALATSPGRGLADALQVARGRIRVITSGTGSALLRDLGFVEKLLRILEPGGHPSGLDAVVITSEGPEHSFEMQLIGGRLGSRRPHAVVLTAAGEERLLAPLEVDADDPVTSLAKECMRAGLRVQWRHVDYPDRGAPPASGGERVALPRWAVRERRGGELAKEWRNWPARLPAMPRDVPRWAGTATWTPPQSLILTRHREQLGERRVVTTSRTPPRGFDLEYDLGCARVFALEGTERLIRLEDGGYATLPRGDWSAAPGGAEHLGYVESVGFVGLEPLILADHPRSGQRVLVSGFRDPLMNEIQPLQTLGFVEAFPANPPFPPHADSTFGLVGLTRSLDARARRHRAAVGELPEGEPIGELGGLLEDGGPPSIPVWIVEGTLVTGRHLPPLNRVRPTAAARWTLAPLAWRGFSSRMPKARALTRRAIASAVTVGRQRPRAVPEPDGPPAGWLMADGVPGTWPLYAAYHPVTGDQLLSTNRYEAIAMSYGEPELLGYLWPAAPVTGSLDQAPVAIPWASRFGLEAPRR
jgi:glycosyltransferase involved in cell wall biosynthesis